MNLLENGWPHIKLITILCSLLGYKPSSLEQEIDKLKDILNQIDTRVLIMVDDLDRLFPSELYSLMRVIDNIRSLPNTAFLLAYDPLVTRKNFENAVNFMTTEI